MGRAEVSVVLDRLARRFENAEQPVEGCPGLVGWGQFLDDPVTHRQTGPFGTSAGLIVSALAGRGTAALASRLVALPTLWWNQWQAQESDGYRLFCQTLRLAFFYLALKISGILDENGIRSQVQEELLRRSLPSGLWGNYWASDAVRDQTPRLFCSSVVVLCLSILEEVPQPLAARLEPALRGIEDRLLGDADLPLLHVAAASAAVLAARGTKISSKVRKRIRKSAWSLRAQVGDLSVYFYDFQYADSYGHVHVGRDYFIVPPEILMGIAGFEPGAPAALRQRAEAAAKALLANIRTNQGVYRPDQEQRVSSKNQAWAALLLSLSLAPAPGSKIGKLLYGLRKERTGNWFTEAVFPLLSLLAITSEIVFFRDLGPLVNVATGLGGLFVSALYGPTFLRKWFPGR